MVNNPVLEKQKEAVPLSLVSMICIAVILACALLTGFIPQMILSFIVLAMCFVLMLMGDIYLAFPVMLFYNAHFGLVLGIAVYRCFSFLLLAGIFLKFKSIKIKTLQIAPLVLFALYCVFVIAVEQLQPAIFAIFDFICILLLINHYLCDQSKVRKFFTVYVLTTLASFVTGIKAPRSSSINIMIGDELVETVRNCATFEDPNYAGCFYTVAIFALVTLKLFTPMTRRIIIVALYAMMLSMMSVTAIVANIVLWLLYLTVTKKINIKTLILILMVAAVLSGLYNYGLENPDAPVVGAFSYRIEEKIFALDEGNYNDATSNRTDLAEYHWEYFKNQNSLLRLLFGGNAASTLKTDLDGFRTAAHNEYVDLLLNVGLVGALIWIAIILWQGIKALRNYWRTKNDQYMFTVMTKCIWLIYAGTLTMFGDYRFSFLFFV